MSLWEDMLEPCQLWELRRVSDGEGGFARVWSPAAEFEAAVVHDGTTQDRVAEKQGIASTWTITTKAELSFHDVFKRKSDGKAFRVVSDAQDGAEVPDGMMKVWEFEHSQIIEGIVEVRSLLQMLNG